MTKRDFMRKQVLSRLEDFEADTDRDYGIDASFKDFASYVKLGTTFNERLQILIMCYMARPQLDELATMSVTDVYQYIKETDYYFKQDKKYLRKCFKLIFKAVNRYDF